MASAEGCSKLADRFEFVLSDPVRDSRLKFVVPPHAGPIRTLDEVLAFYRSADFDALASEGYVDPAQRLELARYADNLFLLDEGGDLGDLVPGLRFMTGDKVCEPDHPLVGGAGPVRIGIDRSQTGYIRNWPAYLARRWGLRAEAYHGFVESVVETAYGQDAALVLQLDDADKVRRFLRAVGKRIYTAPYETYSRYLEPYAPFRSCDQTLDRLLEGDGGNCAEKAMVLYFIAHAYGLRPEVVLGGEDASGSFPYRALRSILNQQSFDFAGTKDAQRYWQHYAILCRAPGEELVFCDVAGSNIPFLCLDAEEASVYLDPERREPIRVTITLEPISLYYHRLERRQDVPLDLYYAMENFIEAIDIIHTVDNELGLLHTRDYWLGAIAYRGPRELGRIRSAYQQYVRRAGRDPQADLGFAQDLVSPRHALFERFLVAYPREAGRIVAADARLRQRIRALDERLETCYVLIRLAKKGTE